MRGHGEKLLRRQEQAIMALLSCSTFREAAELAGIGEATLYRWMQLEQFEDAYREAREQALKQAIARLQQATTQAVETLQNIMIDNSAPPSSGVSAAKTTLEISFKAYEVGQLSEKVKELEEVVCGREDL